MSKSPIVDRAIELGLHESAILDCKRTSYDDSKEWLKDVTAFANATGGQLLLGVDTDGDGRASGRVGLQIDSIDDEIAKLGNWLRTLTDPDVSNVVRMAPETDDEGRKYIVVDVEESALGPHRLTVQSAKFGGQVFVRKGSSSVPVTMMEIRDMIVGSQRTPKLISDFLKERQEVFSQLRLSGMLNHVHNIRSGDFTAERYMAVRVCPRRGFGNRRLVDWALENREQRWGHDELQWSTIRPNPDGAISIADNDECSHHLFYNGSVELIYARITGRTGDPDDSDAEEFVPGTWLKRYFDRHVAHVLKLMNAATECDQFEMAVEFEGVEGLRLGWNNGASASPHPIRVNHFCLPHLLVRSTADGAPNADDLREALDLIWRAWGVLKCPL